MGDGCDCCCNIIWFIFGGFEIGLIWCIAGCILCITICGIPMGLECFKIEKFTYFKKIDIIDINKNKNIKHKIL